MFSNLSVDLIIHRLQLFFVSHSWNDQQRILINITTPWFIEKLISNDVVIVFEVFGNLSPEFDKFVSQSILIVIKISYCWADRLSKVIFRPWVFFAWFSRWIFIFINLIRVIKRPWESHMPDIFVVLLGSPIWDSFTAEFPTPHILMHIQKRIYSSFPRELDDFFDFVKIGLVELALNWLSSSP